MNSVQVVHYHFPKDSLNPIVDPEFQYCSPDGLSLDFCEHLGQKLGVFITACSSSLSSAGFDKNKSCVEKTCYGYRKLCYALEQCEGNKTSYTSPELQSRIEIFFAWQQFCKALPMSTSYPWQRKIIHLQKLQSLCFQMPLASLPSEWYLKRKKKKKQVYDFWDNSNYSSYVIWRVMMTVSNFDLSCDGRWIGTENIQFNKKYYINYNLIVINKLNNCGRLLLSFDFFISISFYYLGNLLYVTWIKLTMLCYFFCKIYTDHNTLNYFPTSTWCNG